jgi:hypothetical protein
LRFKIQITLTILIKKEQQNKLYLLLIFCKNGSRMRAVLFILLYLAALSFKFEIEKFSLNRVQLVC